MHHIRYITVFLILLPLFAIGFFPDASQAAQPTATITLDQAEQTAKVGSGEDGIVRFTGQVEAQMIGPGSNIQMIVVTLQAECVWATTISPTTMSFSAQSLTPKNFEVVVKVPNYTSASISEELTVTGTVGAKPGVLTYKIPPAKGIINIAPYNILTLTCNEPVKEALRGESLSYQLKIKNDGNSNARVTVGINDYTGLAEKGWVIRGPGEKILIDEGKEHVAEIHVIVPKGAPLRTDEFAVNGTSDAGPNATDYDEYTLFTDVVNRKTANGPGDDEDDEDDDEDQDDMPEPDHSLTIANIRSEPEVPFQSTDVKVFAVIRSHHRIDTARVNYWFANSTSLSVLMKRSGTEYYANLGRFTDGVTLFYNITAADTGNNVASSPTRSVKVGAASGEAKVVEDRTVPGFGPHIVLAAMIMAAIIYGSRRR